MSKRILTLILAVMLVFISGCGGNGEENDGGSSDAVSQADNLWDTETLREFGLKNAKCPEGAVATSWDYREKTHSLIAVVTNLKNADSIVKELFESATKSSSGAVTDAYGKAITDYKDCLNQFDMYVFYYQANGQKLYASVIYYDQGSSLLNYDPNTALITLRNVEYINY